MAATMLRALFIMLVASYTNALIVGTRPAMVPKVQLRAQEAPPPPPKGKLGATVDQDGKSNVWVRCSPRVRRASRAPLRADSAPLTVHTQPTLCPHHHLHHHHHHHHQHHHHHHRHHYHRLHHAPAPTRTLNPDTTPTLTLFARRLSPR
jgi:hypothetical protein